MNKEIEEQVFECIGKGGEYTIVAAALGAGTLKEHDCLFVYKNAEGIHFVRTHDDFWDRMRAIIPAPSIHPLMQCLRDNGDLIAAQATIAQQAQMIEHLRGGPTPLFTAVDMGTAAADGRRSLAEHLIKQIAIEHPDQDTLLTVKHIAQWIALEAGL